MPQWWCGEQASCTCTLCFGVLQTRQQPVPLQEGKGTGSETRHPDGAQKWPVFSCTWIPALQITNHYVAILTFILSFGIFLTKQPDFFCSVPPASLSLLKPVLVDLWDCEFRVLFPHMSTVWQVTHISYLFVNSIRRSISIFIVISRELFVGTTCRQIAYASFPYFSDSTGLRILHRSKDRNLFLLGSKVCLWPVSEPWMNLTILHSTRQCSHRCIGLGTVPLWVQWLLLSVTLQTGVTLECVVNKLSLVTSSREDLWSLHWGGEMLSHVNYTHSFRP